MAVSNNCAAALFGHCAAAVRAREGAYRPSPHPRCTQAAGRSVSPRHPRRQAPTRGHTGRGSGTSTGTHSHPARRPPGGSRRAPGCLSEQSSSCDRGTGPKSKHRGRDSGEASTGALTRHERGRTAERAAEGEALAVGSCGGAPPWHQAPARCPPSPVPHPPPPHTYTPQALPHLLQRGAAVEQRLAAQQRLPLRLLAVPAIRVVARWWSAAASAAVCCAGANQTEGRAAASWRGG